MKYVMVTLTILLLISCSKNVYTYQDGRGESRIFIYDDNYKYVEKSMYGKFHIWGKYQIKQDSIYLDLWEMDRIPFSYLSESTTPTYKNTLSEYFQLHLVDGRYQDPIILALVLVRDSSLNIIDKAQSDMDGRVSIRKSDNIAYLDIDYEGYARHRIRYGILKTHNLRVNMEKLDPGGKLSEGCLIYEMGGTLKYKINTPKDIKLLEHNGIVHKLTD